jgi:hypothetical protein
MMGYISGEPAPGNRRNEKLVLANGTGTGRRSSKRRASKSFAHQPRF